MYTFEYSGTISFEKSFLVDQLGNFALESTYSDGTVFYLVNMTDMGFSKLFTIGPIYPGLDNFCDSEEFSFSVKKIKFNQAKIEREISSFTRITRHMAKLENVEEILLDEVLLNLPDLKKIMTKKD